MDPLRAETIARAAMADREREARLAADRALLRAAAPARRRRRPGLEGARRAVGLGLVRLGRRVAGVPRGATLPGIAPAAE